MELIYEMIEPELKQKCQECGSNFRLKNIDNNSYIRVCGRMKRVNGKEIHNPCSSFAEVVSR